MYRLLVLVGDGIGPEVMAQVRRVAHWFILRHDLPAELVEAPFGASAFAATGDILPTRTLEEMLRADAILFGAMGGTEYERIPLAKVLQGSVLRIRQELNLYANMRPVRHWPMLGDACPLRPEVARGTDLLLIRENIGGMYFGEPRGMETLAAGEARAFNTHSYTTSEIERVARIAFYLARERSGQVCSVDKSNTHVTGRFWRETVQHLRDASYPDIRLSHKLADHCAMQLVSAPSQFDIVLTDNVFGDILSDVAGAIAGSIGMLPSANFGELSRDGHQTALYEPLHGAAPDIAGQNIANPIGALLSFAMCLRYTLRRPEWAQWLENVISDVLSAGYATPDIRHKNARLVSTEQMGDAIIAALEQHYVYT